jgi:hypothetical protein
MHTTSVRNYKLFDFLTPNWPLYFKVYYIYPKKSILHTTFVRNYKSFDFVYSKLTTRLNLLYYNKNLQE